MQPAAAIAPESASILDDAAVDAALVGRARDGERRALRGLYDRHVARVRAYLYRLLGADPDLDDLVQTVFTRAFLALGSFRGDARFSTWLYQICVNQSRNLLRSRYRRGRMLGAFESLALARGDGDEGGDPGAASEALRLLQRLRPDLREIFVLYHHEGLTLQEIAGVVGMPLSTVGDRLTRARRELQGFASQRGVRGAAVARRVSVAG